MSSVEEMSPVAARSGCGYVRSTVVMRVMSGRRDDDVPRQRGPASALGAVSRVLSPGARTRHRTRAPRGLPRTRHTAPIRVLVRLIFTHSPAPPWDRHIQPEK